MYLEYICGGWYKNNYFEFHLVYCDEEVFCPFKNGVGRNFQLEKKVWYLLILVLMGMYTLFCWFMKYMVLMCD